MKTTSIVPLACMLQKSSKVSGYYKLSCFMMHLFMHKKLNKPSFSTRWWFLSLLMFLNVETCISIISLIYYTSTWVFLFYISEPRSPILSFLYKTNIFAFLWKLAWSIIPKESCHIEDIGLCSSLHGSDRWLRKYF